MLSFPEEWPHRCVPLAALRIALDCLGKFALRSPTALAAENEAIFCAALATGKAKRERAEMIGATITECAKALFFLDPDQAVGVGQAQILAKLMLIIWVLRWRRSHASYLGFARAA